MTQRITARQVLLSTFSDYIIEATSGSGTGDNISITIDMSITDGTPCTLLFKVPSTNTSTTPTLTISGWTAKTIVREGNTPLLVGDLDGWCVVRYDSSIGKFVLINTSIQQPMNRVVVPTTKVIGATTTIKNSQDVFEHFESAGVVQGGAYVNNGDGTIGLSSCEVVIRSSTSSDAPFYVSVVPGVSSLALTNNATNYVSVSYNAGTPIYTSSTSTTSFNQQDVCLIYVIYRTDNVLNIIDVRFNNVDSHRKLQHILVRGWKYISRKGGSVLNSPSNTYISVTSGEFYLYGNTIAHGAFDTSVAGTANSNVYALWYRNGSGGFIKTISQKSINTLLYDNNTGIPVSIDVNKYSVSWVYIVHDTLVPSLHVVMGQNQYNTFIEALVSKEPTSLPNMLVSSGSLIGCVIYKSGGSTFEDIRSTTLQPFTSQLPLQHDHISNILGGGTYHLSSTQYTDLTDGGDSLLHYHASDRDRANHTGTQLASTISDFASAALSAAPAETVNSITTIINSASEKLTLSDADRIPLMDSANSNLLKWITWTNTKLVLQSWLGTAAFNNTGDFEVAGAVAAHELTYNHSNYDSHLTNTLNPHNTTYSQVGAEPAGAVATHEGALNPHPQYATGGAQDTHSGRTDNPHNTTYTQVGADAAGTASSLMSTHLATYGHLSPTQLLDLTDSGDSLLHYHASDRNRANHTGTQLASTISDFVSAVVGTITGGASSIVTSNLTINRALISDASGKVAVSTVTNTELGYVSGVTSSIQTQLNGKLVPGSYGLGQTGATELLTDWDTGSALIPGFYRTEGTTVASVSAVFPTTDAEHFVLVGRGLNSNNVWQIAFPRTTSTNTNMYWRRKTGGTWRSWQASANTVTLTGDISGSATFDATGLVTLATSLSNTGVVASSYGSEVSVGTFTVDAKGRITSAANVSIRAGSTSQTGIVQLSTAIDSSSTTQAATPSAVKTAYDLAAAAIPLSQKGVALGVATLGADAKIPTAQLPSFVDDVIEYASLASFPVTGETGKIYVALDTNKTYRWSGTTYVYITSGAVDSVNGYVGVVVLSKNDIGLGNVDNTSDATKVVLSASKLTTARNINGTAFDGTVNITTASWGTSRTLSFTGDVTGSNSVNGSTNVSFAMTLANSGIVAGTYTKTTFDSKGRATSGTTLIESDIPSLNWSKIYSTPTTLSGYGITDAQPLDADLTAIAALAGTSGFLIKTALNTWALDTNTYTVTTRTITAGNGLTGGGDLSADRTITLGTPSTLSGSTTNSVTGTTHTHAISASTELLSGVVELATSAETQTGTDTTRAVHPAGFKTAGDALWSSISHNHTGVYEPAGSVATHAALTTTHGVIGTIVGTSDTQTLTNKTYSSGVLSGTFSGDHTISGAATFTSATSFNNQILMESGSHRISYNDGGGNFNLRIGHEYASSADRYTVSGAAAVHFLVAHDTGTGPANAAVTIKMSEDATTKLAGDPIVWDATLYMRRDGTFTWNSNTIWHAGNDGSGSGLDSDLLDSQHGSYYLDLTNATGTLVATKGGTGLTSYTTGDILFASSSTALSTLTAVATGNALISGGVGVAPTWGKIGLTTHVTGTLAIGNGGTGSTTASGARTALGATTVGSNLFTLANPSAITFIRINADNTVSTLDAASFRTAIGAGTSSTTGTVTSVAMTVPIGLTVSGSPITTSGTLAVTFTAGYSIPTTTSQTNWDTAYTDRLKWDGGATGLNAATGRTSLGATTVGSNLFTLINPSAVTFLRVNADNTVSALDATSFRTAIGAGTGNGTVTSIATNNGITGGTIITTGTIGLTGQALALHNLATNGIIVRTNTDTVTTRTITQGTGISITNGDGVAGNPTITNSDLGSSQSIFKNIANSIGTVQFSATTNNDSIRFAGTGTASVSFDSLTKTITINATDANTTYTDGNGIGLTGTTFSVSAGTGLTQETDGLSLTAITAGSTTVGAIRYNGTTKVAGQFDGGTTAPSNTTRLNYDGHLYATKFWGGEGDFTGAVVITHNNTGGLQVNKTSTTSYSGITFTVNGTSRWLLYTTNTEETGGDVGTDLILQSRDDTGVAKNGIFSCIRSTGEFRITAPIFTVSGNTVWHAGNDGAGSGLDADLLDGQHGSYYLALANATGTLAVANGGTGLASYTIGDLIYASGTTTLSKLADVATGNALISGGVGAIPSWGKIGLTTHVSGTLPVANGGTGATNIATARTNLGATTVGSNLFTLTNPSAITFLRVNADNTVSALDAATFRTAIGAGTSSTTGTVTSIATGNGITGGTITTTGTLGLTGQALALHNLATNGIIVRTAADTVTTRSIASGTGITVTNGDGVAGNPSIAITSITAGSTTVGTIRYNGTTKTAGQLDGGTTAPSNTTRLNYDGYLYATRFYGDGSNLTALNASQLTSGTVPDLRISGVYSNITDLGLGASPLVGPVTALGAITGGSGYTDGSYLDVALTGSATGTYARGNIVVSGGAVTSVTLVDEGERYLVGDVLSANVADIGGTGSGFSVSVATVRRAGLYIYGTLDGTSSPRIRLHNNTTTVASGTEYGSILFGSRDSSVGARGDKVRLIALATGNSGGGKFQIWTSTNGEEPTLGFEFAGNNAFRMYDSAGTYYHAFTNTPTANRSVALPDGDVTLTAGTTLVTTDIGVSVAAFSHTHSYIPLSGSDSITGTLRTTGYMEAGYGTGSVALTANDGYGNASVAFNHRSGTPDVDGSSGRIHVNVDSSTNAQMTFELKSGVTVAGGAIALTDVMWLTETTAQVVGTMTATQFTSSIATGTAPLVVSSTTKVTNLNADKLDDQEGTYYLDLTNATGTLAVAKGGTGLASYTIGDLIYASGTTTLSKLAGVATGNALISGGVGVIPSWGKIGLTTHVSGTLPVANGGTGVTTSTGSGSVVLNTSPGFTTGMTITRESDTASENPQILSYRRRAGGAAISGGDDLLAISAYGKFASDVLMTKLWFDSSANSQSGDVGGELVFNSRTNSADGSTTERLRIGLLGHIKIASTGGLVVGSTTADRLGGGSRILTLGTITGGSGYTDGTYNNVTLTNSAVMFSNAVGATADITVSGGVVTVVTLKTRGSWYYTNDSLSAAAADIGGTGSGFSVLVATIDDADITVTRGSGSNSNTIGATIRLGVMLDNSSASNDILGKIDFYNMDTNQIAASDRSGLVARISAHAVNTNGGGYLGFYASTYANEPSLQLKITESAATFTNTVSATTYTSTVSTGTAPLTIASTTLVTNLNAEMLGGKKSAEYYNYATVGNFMTGFNWSCSEGGTTVSITAGACTDMSNGFMINGLSLGTTTKTLGTLWSSGGLLDTGSLSNGLAYFLYVISNGTTTSFLASTSNTSPTMPSGYTYKRLIGAVNCQQGATTLRGCNTHSAGLKGPSNYITVDFTNPILDKDQTLLTGDNLIAFTYSVPAGISEYIEFHMNVVSTEGLVYITSPTNTGYDPSISAAPLAAIREPNSEVGVGKISVYSYATTPTQQLNVRVSVTTTFRASILGYSFFR